MNFRIIPKHAPATPTLSQFQTFAARSGIDVRVDAPAVRQIDGRSVLYTGVAIRCAVGDAGWRAVAPNVDALRGADHDGFVGRLAGSLAWLRFFDLVALPRDGALNPRRWEAISTCAVADHLAAMLDVPSPDPSTLDDLLASWRGGGLKGVVRDLRRQVPVARPIHKPPSANPPFCDRLNLRSHP
jgi:hypothetical protein